METVKEKIAYLRGIIDGDSSLQEGRVRFLFEKTLQILEDLAHSVDELDGAQRELDEYLQEIDFDLACLEDEYFAEEDECAEDDDEDDWDLCESLVEVECPECGDIVTFDEDFLFDEGVQIRCPRCDAIVFETGSFDDLEELFSDEEGPDED